MFRGVGIEADDDQGGKASYRFIMSEASVNHVDTNLHDQTNLETGEAMEGYNWERGMS